MHTPAAFQNAENRCFLAGPAPRFAAHPGGAEVALVHFDLTLKRAFKHRQFGHPVAQKRINRHRGLVVQTHQPGGTIGSDVFTKQAQKIAKLSLRNSPPKQIPVFQRHCRTLS